VGFRHHRSVALGRGAGSLSASGIGISARIPEPRAADDEAAEPLPLPPPARPRMAMRTRHVSFMVSRYRRAFRRGLIALSQGNPGIALAELEQASLKGGARHASVQLFVGLSLMEVERMPEAASVLRSVVASDAPLPDRLMRRHLSAAALEVHMTPNITAHTGMDRGGVALLLAEVLQHAGRPQEAIDLLETFGARTNSAALALCLADRYLMDGEWREVERVTDAFETNVDDLSLQILILRARAQRELGEFIPTLTTLREALRFKQRDRTLLNQARYERALMYEAEGKRALARKDLERIFDREPGFLDVARRLEDAPLALSDYDLELLPSDAG